MPRINFFNMPVLNMQYAQFAGDKNTGCPSIDDMDVSFLLAFVDSSFPSINIGILFYSARGSCRAIEIQISSNI